MARSLITRYGMTDEFDMTAMETVQNQYLGGDTSLSCAPQTASRIDEMVSDTIREAHKKALALLKENEDKLRRLSEYLLEKETVSGEEFMKLLEQDKPE